jgi:hypothetical protein
LRKKNSSPAKAKKKTVSLAPVVPIEGELITLPKRRGRPERKYTEELANEILARTADGEGLLNICQSSHMPHERTVRRWVTDDMPPGFADRFARAVDLRHDRWADEVVSIADEPAKDMAEVQRNRLRVDSRKWILSKLKPERFGDRVDLNVTNKAEKISDDQLEAQLTALMQAKKQDASALETILDDDKPKMIAQRPDRLAIAKPKPKPVEQYGYGYTDEDDEDDLPRQSVRLVRQG